MVLFLALEPTLILANLLSVTVAGTTGSIATPLLTQGGGVWYTGTEARTSWMDATIYKNPYATKYDASANGTFPTVVGQTGLGQTTYFEHEVGTDQVNEDGSTTTVASFIKSFDPDFAIVPRKSY